MIHRLFAYSFIILGIAGTIYLGVKGIYGEKFDVPSISFESFSRQIEDSNRFIIVDVRTEAEIMTKPSPWKQALHIPLLALEERCIELAEYRDQPVMLLCPTGNRSRQGARILRLAGFDAYYLDKGMFKGRKSE